MLTEHILGPVTWFWKKSYFGSITSAMLTNIFSLVSKFFRRLLLPICIMNKRKHSQLFRMQFELHPSYSLLMAELKVYFQQESCTDLATGQKTPNTQASLSKDRRCNNVVRCIRKIGKSKCVFGSAVAYCWSLCVTSDFYTIYNFSDEVCFFVLFWSVSLFFYGYFQLNCHRDIL